MNCTRAGNLSAIDRRGSLSEKCPFGCFYPFQSSAEGRSSSELRTFRTAWGGGEGWASVILAGLSVESPRSGYRAIHDFTVQRGRSPLWISNPPRYHGSAWKVMLCISNHPRYHGSAWKVTALNIEPSTISRFSVESHALDIEPSTISWFSVESHRSGY